MLVCYHPLHRIPESLALISPQFYICLKIRNLIGGYTGKQFVDLLLLDLYTFLKNLEMVGGLGQVYGECSHLLLQFVITVNPVVGLGAAHLVNGTMRIVSLLHGGLGRVKSSDFFDWYHFNFFPLFGFGDLS